MASQKPLIIPWLIGKIGSLEYPGLEWDNHEKTRFRVPWKYNRKKNMSEDDINIFKGWAIASGCYDPKKHEPDPARWKRNFRAALNQKNTIRMVANNKSNNVNPHKVFEITREDSESFVVVPSEPCAGTGATPVFHQADDIATSQQIFMTQERYQPQLYSDSAALYCNLEDVENAFAILDASAPGQEIDWHILSSQVHTEGAAAYYEGACAIGGDVPPHIINEVPAGNIQPDQDQGTFQQQILRHFTYNSFETDFDVNIYYRGTKVDSTTVTNRFGFCLNSGKQPPPESYLEDVTLPKPQEKVNDLILVTAVNKILTTLDQGILVEVRDGAICGKRLGKCRSFWTVTDTPTTVLPNPIEKNDYSVLYTLQQFVTELIQFVEGRRRESPQYSIWICLGEKWPDNNPWKTKCIMVEIIPVVMRLLHQLSYSTGASSLRSSELNLEISDSLSSQSAVLSLLRSIEDMMDWC
ncbi:interferon regulatory factor 3-like [Mantella aurantiaca]